MSEMAYDEGLLPALGGLPNDRQSCDPGGGGAPPQPDRHFLQGFPFSLGLDFHGTVGKVADPSREPEGKGSPGCPVAEAHSLHPSLNEKMMPFHRQADAPISPSRRSILEERAGWVLKRLSFPFFFLRRGFTM